MALAAALAVNHHLLCFSNPRTVTWVPTKLKSQKRAYLSFTSCTSSSSSSSSTSPEADLQTAESRVNLGLSLFSKGRDMGVLNFGIFWAQYDRIDVQHHALLRFSLLSDGFSCLFLL
ncbi:hypothetical protein CK203_071435 [Vitis vinifera]|uniref:Uncharacterized protein n=1 Tax=Vitis vinifera TaxID=29760 RepID=A0A438F3T5_VITVI|nr:hypothetical protein CK203_071435 [Vitis vinifera]